MSEPFLAEIKMVGFNYPPKGWAFCDGQIMPITQNQALYSLLGITYGGDGRTTFALPDLRGRTPIHKGAGIALGGKSGAETVTLTYNELAPHTHAVRGTTANGDRGQSNSTGTRSYATVVPDAGDPNDVTYGPAANLVPLGANMVTAAGGDQSHNNMQPYLTLSFCIALQGLFPTRN